MQETLSIDEEWPVSAKDTLQQLIDAVDKETGATMPDESIKSEVTLLM
jgi:hypothetical protein